MPTSPLASGHVASWWARLGSFKWVLLLGALLCAWRSPRGHFVLTRDENQYRRDVRERGMVTLLLMVVGPEGNLLVDYVRWVLLLFTLGVAMVKVENSVHDYSAATERAINQRRSDPESSEQLLVLDLVLVKILLVFFPSVQVQHLSFAQAVRATANSRLQRNESATLQKGVKLLSFHHNIRAKTNTGITLVLIHCSAFVVVLLVTTLATLHLPSATREHLVACLHAAAVVRVLVPFASAANVILSDLQHQGQESASASPRPLQNSWCVISSGVQACIWMLTLICFFSALGFDMTSYLAGLGISSIAAAFAAQRTLSELFATAALLADRPFDVGDRIVVDGLEGVVERIGFRSTYMRKLYNGEAMVVPNADIIGGAILNRSQMTHRRVKEHLRVDAIMNTAEKLHLVRNVIEQAVGVAPCVSFVYAHLMSITATEGAVFEYVYIVNDGESRTWKDAQHVINMQILLALEQHQIKLSHVAASNISIR